MSDLNEKVEEFLNTDDNTAEYDSTDIENNKLMAALSYLGILFLIPMLAAKDSKFARFHANQGIVLFITNVLNGVILGTALRKLPLIGWAFGIASSIIGVILFVFAILGIINVVNGRAKELPLIGNISLLK
jgi:uncharacterized membrane protein